jgi:L-fuconolactonase
MLPEGPITDSHLHCWDLARLRYPWLASVPALNRAYLMIHYGADGGSASVTRRVFVQADCDAAQARDEVAWVGAQPEIDAIVAFAPLERGETVTAELAWLARQPKVRGVRRILQGESDPSFALAPDFVSGVRALASFGLTCDLCINATQLPAVTELVRRCPEVSFVLDHLGKPPIRAGRLDPWRDDLAALARLPNVVAKVSGLSTEADLAGWTPADLAPYVEHAVTCFGWSRLLFGSDWPVVNLAGGLSRWRAALAELTAGATPAECRAFLHENAGRTYRLG